MLLPQRADITSAVCDAHHWLAYAIAHADRLSVASAPQGHGQVHHFHVRWPAA
ncbi:hypothetical protein [Propionivibrio dicarboxylicus]|uniref:Hydroxymethylpyrimidine/phosphomethylpyrimidine kinase n=1 Tax=Propionivibrio dicarboxylicus TaxID=83767 RepID=A0A1G7Z5N7_9RHOO|nr:hypothetical protein [Propionivibrio dicarboxylicus]SDH03806.1 hydroxymethylpyrimidine/phosphomethylpyrimidine kinase [Propionivibrio dicarboxylicus]